MLKIFFPCHHALHKFVWKKILLNLQDSQVSKTDRISNLRSCSLADILKCSSSFFFPVLFRSLLWNIACCPEAALKCCAAVFSEVVLLTLFLFCLSVTYSHTFCRLSTPASASPVSLGEKRQHKSLDVISAILQKAQWVTVSKWYREARKCC